MKKLVVCTAFVILVLIALFPAVNAGSDNMNNISGLVELPEMDMTGLHTEIPLIEIDPEIMNATPDWIVLAHDEDGKKSLLDDIDQYSVSAAEKTDMKNALKTVWITYPVKFEPVWEKSIEITVQSDGSNRTVSIPIGHVTRISFDREKMGKAGDSTIIVLPEVVNQTIRNISILRVNNITATPAREPSTSGSGQTSSSPGNSFSSGNSFRSDFSSSSGQILDSRFPSSSGNGGGYPGNGLVAWSGGAYVPFNSSDPYHGHNSFIYWACNHLNYQYATSAADVAMAPDTWPQKFFNPPIFGMTDFFKSIFADIIHCWGHYYNPDIGIGYAPGEAKLFADFSKSNYSSGNYVGAAQDLGHASHFMTDAANPMHTGQELNQVWDKILTPHDTHSEYETFVYSNWSSTSAYKFGDLVKNNNYSYRVRSPDEATINIATFSHAYVDTLYYRVKNKPGVGFYSDPTVKSITENCVLIAARYTGGLVKYTQSSDIAEIPIADFDADPQSGAAPLMVHFTDRTHYYGSLPTTWNWSFGDGFFSNLRYPYDHEYQNNGNYTVKLTVSNANGQSNKTMIISVVGSPAPVADFNYATTGPSTLHFTDISANSPTSWVWDFGDGSNASVEQNPTHHYSGGMFITVRLIASNVYGATYKDQMILVNNPWPHADFIPSRTSGPRPLPVQFTDNSTNYADNWTWNFGDNSPVSYQRNTSHVYDNPGNYSVVLKASNSYGNTTSTRVISVTSIKRDNVGVFRNSTSSWYLNYDKNGSVNKTFSFGTAGDIPVVGDWNGDGYSDVGYFRNSTGNWSLDTYNNGTADYSFHFGTPDDKTVVGDWNGDGTSDVGVFRPPSGYWYLNSDKNGSVNKSFHFGKSGDIPVVGDYNLDGYTDAWIFRPSTGYWYLDSNLDGTFDQSFHFGTSEDIPVVGNFNGIGNFDAGVFRPSSGNWYFDFNLDGTFDQSFHFGTSGDVPVVGDWNGDGNSDVGVFRPASGNWYLDTYNNGTADYAFQFGGLVDSPIVGKWV